MGYEPVRRRQSWGDMRLLLVVTVAGLGCAAAAPSLTCEQFTRSACEGPSEFRFHLATDVCYSKAEVQSTLGLDATYAAQLSAPFYSWTSAAWDALVVPIPCDDDECSVVRSPRSEYTLGLVRTLHAQFWRIGKGVPPRLQTGAKVSTTKQVKESVDTSVFEFSRLPCQRLSFWTSDLENPAAGETLMKPVGVAMARGQVGPWVMGQCMEVQQGQGDGWVSARAAVRSARCTVHYKTQAAFDVLGVLLYVGGAACVLAMGVQWHRRTSAAAFSAC